MTRRKWICLAVAMFAAGAVAAGWVVFLVRQGLDHADKWSSVLGVLLTVVFGVAGLLASRRSPPDGGPPGGFAAPEARGGSTFHINTTHANVADEMTINHYEGRRPPHD
jgi:hypothetical protein